MIIYAFYCSVCLVSMIQLGSSNWISDNCVNIPGDFRPDFYPSIRRRFKTAHFNNAAFDLEGNNQRLRARGEKEMSLNHVLSWRAIKQTMSDYVEAFYTENSIIRRTRTKMLLRDFIRHLFTPDAEAYVRTDSSTHAFRRVSEGHVAYLRANGAGLIARNTAIQTRAMDTLTAINYPIGVDNCPRIKTLLTAIFSAPANLRYGMDDKLDDLLDPMGDADGKLTGKESRYISSFGYNTDNNNWHKTTANNIWYLESSTGMQIRERRNNFQLPSYWIECSATNPACRLINV